MKISKGFTLIELLIVMAVLGVLATIIVIAVNPAKRINQANDARIKTDIAQITRAIQAYVALNGGNFPPSLDTIVASGEIKQIPSPPVNESYSSHYAVTTDNEAVLSFPLQDKPGYLWCWASKTNQIKEVKGATCSSGGNGISSANFPDTGTVIQTTSGWTGTISAQAWDDTAGSWIYDINYDQWSVLNGAPSGTTKVQESAISGIGQTPITVSKSVNLSGGNLSLTGTLAARPSSPNPSGRFVVEGQRYDVVDLLFDGVVENCCETKDVQIVFSVNAGNNNAWFHQSGNEGLKPGQTFNSHRTFTYGPSTPGTNNGNYSVESGRPITAMIGAFTPLNGSNRTDSLDVGTVF